MPTLMHTIAKNTYISSWRSRECMTMARATTDDRSSLVNHPPSARLEKKRKSPGVLTVCCNHRESNPGLFYIETRRLRQYAFRVRVLWAPRTERRIATLDIGLVHVPPAYCSCENRERVVVDVRRQEFSNILGYPTCDRSARAILLRRVPCLCWQAGILPLDHGCPMYGRVFQMRRKGIAMSMSLVCAPLSSVMGRMGFSFGCGEQSTRSTPLSDAEQRNETQRTMGC